MQIPTDRAERNWVLGVTALASFMMALDAMIITTAFAAIRAEFGSPVETLQWTVNAFNLTFVLLLTGAALGDRFGRRRMFAAGIALFVVASAACALAANATALIAARALQGAGAALVMPLAMAILSGTFGREERARALGIFSSITGCALIIGPAMGGFITEHFGWRWVFWINLPIGLIAIGLVLARLRESFGPSAALDIPGLLLVALAALALVWSLLRGNVVGWASAEVMATLMAGLVFAAGFVVRELRAAAPMVPMRLFASRALAAGMSASVLFYAAMYGLLFLLPQFLQTTLGFDAFGA
ncbi:MULTISPECIES: MFS transporter [unclassified Bradyrhizobium]|uniref:MFS transporter n=1 Tax=unclassified Bradyrhizobium TaxID=2631580 RepID=UPI001FF9A369|nr:MULTISPECIES: MFS transporter [unclassified Bradyrhizobium]